MNKSLLIISFVLISLLAIGAVSASDTSNIMNDSVMQEASSDIDEQLEIENLDDLKDESSQEVEILSGGEKETPTVIVENVTADEYESPVIPFSVVDSNGHLIPGEVVVTVFSEDDISEYTFVPGNASGIDSFKKIDFDELFEFNNGMGLIDFYNMIFSSMNTTNFNPELIMTGISDIYNGITLNVSRLILDLVDYSIIDVSQIGGKIKNIISGFNESNLNFIYNLSAAVNINKSAFTNALNISLNETVGLIKNFLQNKLNLTLSSKIESAINNIANSTEIMKLHDVLTIIKDTYKYNNLTMPIIVNKLDQLTNGTIFNAQSVLHLIFDDFDKISGIASKIIKSINANITEVIGIYEHIKDRFPVNISEVINTVAYITGINTTKISNIFDGIKDIYNGFIFNKTYVSSWIKSLIDGNYTNIASKILNISQLNTSSIKNGFDKLMPEINLKASTLFMGIAIIGAYGKFNTSMILRGLDKIIEGFGANVSTVLSKMFSRIGYHISFPYNYLKPGTYNFTVKYFANDYFNSAVNTATLNIIPQDDIEIHVYMGGLPAKYGDDTPLYIFLTDGYDNYISGVVNVSLNGERIGTVETDKYGYAQYILNNLTNGRYSIEFEYCSTVEGKDFSVNIPAVATNISYSNMTTVTVNTNVDGKIGKYFEVVLKDENGKGLANKEILIGYNGKTYKNFTDENGTYKLQINIQKAGTYTIAACYLGDNIYSASYITAKITVKKQTAKLTAKKQASYKVKAKKKILKATFKSAKGHAIKGKVIKFTVKGKTYSAKTNSKGVASVNVKLTKKGTYKVAVKFAGDSTYNKVTKKISLRIK